MIPAISHKWTCLVLIPARQALLDLSTPEGWKAELTADSCCAVVCCSCEQADASSWRKCWWSGKSATSNHSAAGRDIRRTQEECLQTLPSVHWNCKGNIQLVCYMPYYERNIQLVCHVHYKTLTSGNIQLAVWTCFNCSTSFKWHMHSISSGNTLMTSVVSCSYSNLQWFGLQWLKL